MNKDLFTSACVTLAFWLAATGQNPGPSSIEMTQATITTAEENAVYRAIADQYYKHPVGVPFLLESATTVPHRFYEERNAARLRREAEGTLFDEYGRRSNERVTISDSVAIPGTVRVTDSVRLSIADSLRKRTSSTGVYAFSRVGFTSARDRALVYVFRHCGMSCGSGGLFLLTKQEGKWLLVRQLYASAS